MPHRQTSETDRVYDELLVISVRAGDRKAAERLAARWQPRLLRCARRLLGDADQAQEAVQESWAGICRGWLSLSDPAKFPVWAYGILHRKCADRVRQAAMRRARETDPETIVEPMATSSVEDGIALDAAFARLGDEHRTAALLYFGEGLTATEIAEVTGVPLGTAKTRIFHARQKLRAILTGD